MYLKKNSNAFHPVQPCVNYVEKNDVEASVMGRNVVAVAAVVYLPARNFVSRRYSDDLKRSPRWKCGNGGLCWAIPNPRTRRE